MEMAGFGCMRARLSCCGACCVDMLLVCWPCLEQGLDLVVQQISAVMQVRERACCRVFVSLWV
jgi:hypothetical protein